MNVFRVSFLLLLLVSFNSYSQNAIFGADFADGWNDSESESVSFEDGAGTSRKKILKPEGGNGDKFFRLVTYWDGNFNEWGPSTSNDLVVSQGVIVNDLDENNTAKSYKIENANTNHNFVFKTRSSGNPPANTSFVFFEVQGAVRNINNVTQNISEDVFFGDEIIVTATLDGNLNDGQAVYLRYSGDDFSSSTIVNMSGSGTSYTATIPGSFNTAGKNVAYYVFTSGTDSSNNPLDISGNDADFYTINLDNNSGNNYGYNVRSEYITDDGANNWNQASSWRAGSIPSPTDDVIIDHDLSLTDDRTVDNLTINAGKTLTNTGYTLKIENGGSITNNGTYSDNSGTVEFLGAASVSGNISFNNVTLKNENLNINGVNFGSNSTINGSLTINPDSFVDIGSPIYGDNSTLIYNSANPVGTPYKRRSEWSNAGNNQGRPNNVIVQNNTAINMGFDNTTNDAIIDGDLTIEPGSSLFMDFGSNDMEAPLIVKGNFVNNGTISLSDELNGDLKVEGDFEDNGTFYYKKRALFFKGSNVQEITTSTDPYTIDVVRINKSDGEVIMNQDIIIDKTGDPLQMSQESILNLNGHDLTIGKDGDTSQVSFTDNAALKVSDQSDLILKGNGNMGDLQFDDSNDRTTNKIRYVEIDRGSGSDVSLGNRLYLKDSINLTNGTLNANEYLTFVSDSTETAQVGEVPTSGGNIAGNVIVERFVPKSNRAFRYISSPVNTTGTIFDNLQQGGLNPGDAGYEAGFGTHITGSTSGSNGFDATQTGNPSMFEWDESLTSPDWVAISSTNDINKDTLAVGDAHALMIRGDRSTTLNSNTAVGPATTLRFTGTLEVGDQSVAASNLSSTSGEYNLIANPYQAIVDAKTLLESADATDLDDQTIYVYDPTLGTRGGYVAIDINNSNPSGTPEDNSLSGTTNANQFILPNQAFFVETTGSNPDLTFKETYKNTSETLVETFSDDDMLSEMHINLKRQPADLLVDGVTARFSPNYTNAINNKDADEIWNFDEWVALYNSNHYLSIEKRAKPAIGDSIQIYIGNYQSDSYVWHINMNNINKEAVLVDDYLNTETPLNANDETSIAFDIDSNIPESSDPFRFSIRFTNETLAVDEAETTNFAIYPNPVTTNSFSISGLTDNGEATIQLFDMTGKLVFSTTRSAGKEMTIDIDHSLPTGVYKLQINQDQTQYQSTLIISE